MQLPWCTHPSPPAGRCATPTESNNAVVLRSRLQVTATYDMLCEKLKEVSALGGISGLLGWDEMVMMPPNSAGSRGAQKAALAGVLFDKRTDKELGQLLEALRSAPAGTLDEVCGRKDRAALVAKCADGRLLQALCDARIWMRVQTAAKKRCWQCHFG